MTVLPAGSSFARNIRQRTAGGFVLSEEYHPANAVLPAHAHERPYVSLVLGGGFREMSPGMDRWIGPHVVSFHPAAVAHEMAIGPDGAWTFCVELEEDSLGGPDGFRKLQSTIATAFSIGMWRIYHEIAAGREPDARLSRHTLSGMAGPSFREDPGDGPAWLGGVLDRIHCESHGSLTVSALARSAGVHPFYLGSVFKAHIGCTVLEYVRRFRIAECAHRLQFGAASVVEIAYSTGFADQSHMTRSFRNATGWTPAAFRRHMRTHRP